MDQQVKDKLRIRVNQVFSPATPIDKYALFAGRITQVNEIIAAANQRGQHVILFGERGVGKTSLANVLQEVLSSLGKNLIVPKVNCSTLDDYTDIWRNVLQQITVFRPGVGAGFIPQQSKEPIDLVKLIGEKSSPDTVRTVLSMLNMPLLIILDEFDRIKKEDTLTSMADTVKSLSDFGVDTTILMVGVADTVDDLIKEHHSIDRALIQVHLPRMSTVELQEIVTKGLGSTSMKIDDTSLDYIAKLSQGLPHYTHLLAQLSASRALDADRINIVDEDVRGAVQDAISRTQQSIRSDYGKATYSPRKDTLYKQVLLACALAQVDELGYFSAPDVRTPMSKIMKRKYEIPAFARHLNDFTDPSRGSILQKVGTHRRFRYRFINPLMQPYITMQGIATGLITEEEIRRQ